MAAKTGNDVAIVKVRSEYDNSSAKQVAKEMAASLLQVEKSVGQVDFDINTEKVSQSINEIITLINKKLKKLFLMKYQCMQFLKKLFIWTNYQKQMSEKLILSI